MPTLARPHLTVAEQRQEIPRAVIALVDGHNDQEKRLQVQEGGLEGGLEAVAADVEAAEADIAAAEAAIAALDTRLDTGESDINTLESSRVEGRGNGAAGRIAIWSSANAIDDDSNLTFDGSSLVAAASAIRAGTSMRVGQSDTGPGSGSDHYYLYGSGSDIRLHGHYEFSAAVSNFWELEVWDGSGSYVRPLRGDVAGTALGTGLKILVNVGGTKTTPRVMMGPAANVGKTYVIESFVGNNGAGACTTGSLAAGDVVVNLVGVFGIVGSQAAKFEGTITVNGQIQQTDAGDLTGNVYLVFVERRSATGATTERPLYVVP